MSDEYISKAVEALIDVLKTSNDPEIIKTQQMLLRRLATSGDLTMSRNPAPKNITDVGGYLNLLDTDPAMKKTFISSLLGIPTPLDELEWTLDEPSIPYVSIDNNRPAGAAQASLPLTLKMRFDFSDHFIKARKKLNQLNCQLPLVADQPQLPSSVLITDQLDMLQLMGRKLDIMPGTLLVNPEEDPIAIAKLESDNGTYYQLVLREQGETQNVEEKSWVTLKLENGVIKEQAPSNRRYKPIETIMAEAGWYIKDKTQIPTSLTDLGGFDSFINTTGLIKDKTKVVHELDLLYTGHAITTSKLVDQLNSIWNGEKFE